MVKGVVSWGNIQNDCLLKIDVVFCPGQKLLNLLAENELNVGKFKCFIHIHTSCNQYLNKNVFFIVWI